MDSAEDNVNLCLSCWHPLCQSLEFVSLLNNQKESTDLIFMFMSEQSHRDERHLPCD